MPAPKKRRVRYLHVYFLGGEYYVPTMVRLRNGPWAEALPVARGPQSDVAQLAADLAAAKARDPNAPGEPTFWKDEGPRVLARAEALWALYWYDDGTLCVMPTHHVPTILDPETGDTRRGGWVNEKEKAQILAGDTPFEQVVSMLVTGHV